MIKVGDLKIIESLVPAGHIIEYDILEQPTENDTPPIDQPHYLNGEFVTLDQAKRAERPLRKTSRLTMHIGSLQYDYTRLDTGEVIEGPVVTGVCSPLDSTGDSYFPLQVRVKRIAHADTTVVCAISNSNHKYFIYEPTSDGISIRDGQAYIIRGNININGKSIGEKNVIQISEPTLVSSSDNAVLVLFINGNV